MSILDNLRHLFQSREVPTSQTTPLDQSAYHILDLLAAKQIVDDELAAALRQWAKRPVQLFLGVTNGVMTSPTTADVNDVSFDIFVNYALDAAGQHEADVGPFTWAIAPESAGTLSAGPNASSQHVDVTPADASGNQVDFTVTGTDPSGASGSLVCHPVAGGPKSLVLGVG